MRLFFFLFFMNALFSFPAESSYPHLSGYTWWHFSDWRLTRPDFGKATPSYFDPQKVNLGDTIFVGRDCLAEFARDYLPKLRHPVILISANYGYEADMPLPGPYAFLLDEPKVAAWLVQNIDRPPTDKLIPIPIGLASNYWPHGNQLLLDQMAAPAFKNRELFIYLNFSLSPERQICLEHFQSMGLDLPPRKAYRDYLQDLSNAVFVISPPGGGIDCHRTWEALLLGCYPVVLSNTLNPLYEDLPVVIVQDWKEVTEPFLQMQYEKLKSGAWSREKLYFPYWEQKVRALQKSIREGR